jgi:hypothetical protein
LGRLRNKALPDCAKSGHPIYRGSATGESAPFGISFQAFATTIDRVGYRQVVTLSLSLIIVIYVNLPSPGTEEEKKPIEFLRGIPTYRTAIFILFQKLLGTMDVFQISGLVVSDFRLH